MADTWQAAERTFRSVLGLMQRHPELHFGHSTPALYAWLQQHRPALFAEIQQAMQQGRWEPLNGPWVESDCTLVASASLLRQFQEGQAYSQQQLPGWEHALAWLPDSFGFSSGVPAICRASGVRWFCTHKLFWNSTNPFPHRVFRWRHSSGEDVLALMSAPIGTGGDPLAMAAYSQQWQQSTGIPQGLWLPGVGDHGGGPSQEMLEQLQLWQEQPLSAPTKFGTVRSYLNELEEHQGSCRCGAMSSIWSCIVVAPPAGQTKSATTAPWSDCCWRPIWRKPSAAKSPAAKSNGARCCSSNFTTSFLAPRFPRCLSKPSRSGAKRAGSAASGAIRPWRPCSRWSPNNKRSGGWPTCCQQRTWIGCGAPAQPANRSNLV